MSYIGRVLIYGGRGALGSKCVSHFKTNDFWVGCVDVEENTEADLSIVINTNDPLKQQEGIILGSIKSVLHDCKLDGVFCVAGGWVAGGLERDFVRTTDLMWKLNVCPSIISTSIASKYLKENGILMLTGSKAGLEPSHKLLPYGLSKNTVHYLAKSLVDDHNSLPMGTTVVALVPDILDTPFNRECMPHADRASWTPLDFLADLFFRWSIGEEKPLSGLVQLITRKSKTELKVLTSPNSSCRRIGNVSFMEVPELH
ncbi:unnamed protein product [Brassicogethes aeneus]|uniref:Dihydropteridine reductase n=1 Tax=Brassicogethes aeneus TaxID=1431903 RepID=A0A9P0ARA6_BRAAE|nr:unnamed protein product [Brassicogethes aeneus]